MGIAIRLRLPEHMRGCEILKVNSAQLQAPKWNWTMLQRPGCLLLCSADHEKVRLTRHHCMYVYTVVMSLLDLLSLHK